MWSSYQETTCAFQPALFPLDGKMLTDQGVQGSEIGRRLSATKQGWIDTGEQASMHACLNYALHLLRLWHDSVIQTIHNIALNAKIFSAIFYLLVAPGIDSVVL